MSLKKVFDKIIYRVINSANAKYKCECPRGFFKQRKLTFNINYYYYSFVASYFNKAKNPN